MESEANQEEPNKLESPGNLLVWRNCMLDAELTQDDRNQLVDQILVSLSASATATNKGLLHSVLSNANPTNKSLSTLLLQEAVRAIEQLQKSKDDLEASQSSEIEKRVLSICSFYKKRICSDFILSIKLSKESAFLDLLAALLDSPLPILRAKATQLLEEMLKKNSRRFNAILSHYESMHFAEEPGKSFVKMLYNVIFGFYETYDDADDAKSTKKQAVLIKGLSSDAFYYLLKNSPENCAKIGDHEFKRLVKYLSAMPVNISLCRILDVMICHGLRESWAVILENNVVKIIEKLHGEIVKIMQEKKKKKKVVSHFKSLSIFHKNLLFFAGSHLKKNNKAVVQAKEADLSDEEISKEAVFSVTSAEELQRTDLFDAYLALRTDKLAIGRDDPLNLLRSKQEITRELVERERADIQLRRSAAEHAELSETVLQLQKDYQSLRDEKKQVLEQLRECERKLAKSESSVRRALALPDPRSAETTTSDPTDDDGFKSKILEQGSCSNKDEARRFVDLIARKHREERSYRRLICGTLRNLSASLYTSPLHFLSEIVQNFEDNLYEPTARPWHLRVIVERDYLLFSCNERGFSPADVLAVCSVSESTKTMGQHCGYKGIGFKSVFLCTDNPVVFSRPFWSFEFSREEGQDEMAYITPRFVDLDVPLEPTSKYGVLKTELELDRASTTFLLLPLKDAYHYRDEDAKSREYFREIEACLSEHVLLFTKRIEKIIVNDRINAKLTEFTCEKSEPERALSLFESVQEVVTFTSTIRAQIYGSSPSRRDYKYRVCQSRVDIPDWILGELGFPHSDLGYLNEVTLAFPDAALVAESGSKFPIFALLPVQDLGFKFIINCYWSVSTNRESINEHLSLNQFLRDKVAELFEWAAANEPEVRERLEYYLPKPTAEMGSWWRSFVYDVRDRLKRVVEDILRGDQAGHVRLRLFNEELRCLIDDKQVLLDGAGYKLLDPAMVRFTREQLNFYEVKMFSLVDLIECLTSDNLLMSTWLEARRKRWWELFFRLANQETLLLNKSLLLSAKIFMSRSHQRRIALNSRPLGSVFTCKNKELKLWFDLVCIIDFETSYEEKFLKKMLKIVQLKPAGLVEIIVMKHIACELKSSQEIWMDLKYIKENFDVYKKFTESRDQLSANALRLPLSGLDEFSHLPISHAILSSLFDYDLSQLKMEQSSWNSTSRFADFNGLKALFGLSLVQTLEWEGFLLELGCPLPLTDLEDLTDRIERCDDSLPLLTPIEAFDSVASDLACKLYDSACQRSLNVAELCRHLPVRTRQSIHSDRNIFAVSSIGFFALYEDLLPSVHVPKHALPLAEKLGFSTRPSFSSALQVLRTLIHLKSKKTELYVEWLFHLRSLASSEDCLSLADEVILYLQGAGENESALFCKPSQVYCCESSPGVQLVCAYLDGTLVNSSTNSAFKVVESALLDLGSKRTPSRDDSIECLCRMAQNEALFRDNNPMSYLKPHAQKAFFDVYALLEEALKESFSFDDYKTRNAWSLDLLERQEMVKLAKLRAIVDESLLLPAELDFPVITHDGHLQRTCDLGTECLFVCFLSEVLEHLTNKFAYNAVYLDPEIARNCPHVMAWLGANYLNDLVSMEIDYRRKRPQENANVSLLFREALGEDAVEVYQVNDMSLTVKVRPGAFEDILCEPDSNERCAKTRIFIRPKSVIIQRKYILFKKPPNQSVSNQLQLLSHVLEFALASFRPLKSKQEVKTNARKLVDQLKAALEGNKWTQIADDQKNPATVDLAEFWSDLQDSVELNRIYSNYKTKVEKTITTGLVGLGFQGKAPKFGGTAYYNVLHTYTRLTSEREQPPLINASDNSTASKNAQPPIINTTETLNPNGLSTENTIIECKNTEPKPVPRHFQLKHLSRIEHPEYQPYEEVFYRLVAEESRKSEEAKSLTEATEIGIVPGVGASLDTQKKIGVLAELYFCIYLKIHYFDWFDESKNWVSSARQEVYRTTGPCDDSLGYDFVVDDFKYLFTKSTGDRSYKTCFIEVKGTGAKWNNTFHITKNELKNISRIDKLRQAYLVVVIENVDIPGETKIASVLDLTYESANMTCFSIEGKTLRLEAESYLATAKHVEQDPQVSLPNKKALRKKPENPKKVKTKKSAINAGVSGKK